MKNKKPSAQSSRRNFLRAGALAGGAVLAAPHVRNARAAETATWKVQTSWPGGLGLQLFKDWCNSIIEKTGGELEFKPFGAKDVVGDFSLYDAVKNGVLEAANPFTIYYQNELPLGSFLSSYPMGLRNPHEWDVFYYGLGGIDIVRKAYARLGMRFVGIIHHGPNIIHSKVPINSFEDFRGRKIRAPGGMVSKLFTAAGASTTTLPGSEIFPALEKGTIDAADYVGPAINYDLGFHQVTNYVSMGPPGFMSIYQPVDLMDLTVGMRHWNALSPAMKLFVENEVHAYSDLHHAAIQKADQEAWPKLTAAGTRVTRLSEQDVEKFTALAVPIWFEWAKKSPEAAQAFKIQLDYMMSGSLGYVTKRMIRGYSL
ncbi:MAG: TRAP transporter substrate-binding protein DctP [Gammaproteobacteria bacterium]|nr:TRAP transporter substrate-binding protein DctP [Gammaproteobacteria bacterium]MDD9800536.1 TRAP transporter substrate-binding protein DctP [Gammaproteobacteria bacterium]MDD9815595.1 TRAP transporter substrate-binding protein DctP [Gammaproteobacteria bacterium]MDD9850912.1 TRAP transporter substrate-binding protein DctP [Gammaproteobacteria bacterium]MDD9870330.1 TRAP transporter substrate-binding protein DctP [Gammaproteobacteria bacterium]